MRILVLGSGGREHALVWKLAQSPDVEKIFVAPGNGGMEQEGAQNVALSVEDSEGIRAFAKKESIDLIVPGPELPLTLGIVDEVGKDGIPCFGPDRYAAQLEGSKAFAKTIMERSGVPTARFRVVTSLEDAQKCVQEFGAPVVIKADGLAAGKGVVVAKTLSEAHAAIDEMLGRRVFGNAGAKVVIEECLAGEEVSLLCFCDGKKAFPLPSAQDHKAAFDGDLGPNTGGMGAYSPAPVLPTDLSFAIMEKTVTPILQTLAADGHPFVGVLYAGLMMTKDGPKVLEYNVRFGDPECQPLLMRLESDLPSVMLACIRGTLDLSMLHYSEKTSLGIVLAKKGYPGSYAKGAVIAGIAEAEAVENVKVFHSGTTIDSSGRLISTGGRILCVTALADTLQKAKNKAYEAIAKITIEDSFYRKDIGDKGIMHLESGV